MWITQDIAETKVPRLNVHTNHILVHTFSHGTLAQDKTESRMSRLNAHTNHILVHKFSHGTLDSVVS